MSDLGPGQRSCVGVPSPGEKLMAEIENLERNKREVSDYNKKWLGPSLSKDEWWYVTSTDGQMDVPSNQEIRAKSAGPARQSSKETFEVVRYVALLEQVIIDNW